MIVDIGLLNGLAGVEGSFVDATNEDVVFSFHCRVFGELLSSCARKFIFNIIW